MLLAADSGQLTALCLLDLTVVFDTVDHDLLLLRLEQQFSLQGVTLQWFHSYLSSGLSVCYNATSHPLLFTLCALWLRGRY